MGGVRACLTVHALIAFVLINVFFLAATVSDEIKEELLQRIRRFAEQQT